MSNEYPPSNLVQQIHDLRMRGRARRRIIHRPQWPYAEVRPKILLRPVRPDTGLDSGYHNASAQEATNSVVVSSPERDASMPVTQLSAAKLNRSTYGLDRRQISVQSRQARFRTFMPPTSASAPTNLAPFPSSTIVLDPPQTSPPPPLPPTSRRLAPRRELVFNANNYKTQFNLPHTADESRPAPVPDFSRFRVKESKKSMHSQYTVLHKSPNTITNSTPTHNIFDLDFGEGQRRKGTYYAEPVSLSQLRAAAKAQSANTQRHENRTVLCAFCPFQYENSTYQIQVYKHLAQHKSRSRSCAWCNRMFLCRAQRQNHELQTHGRMHESVMRFPPVYEDERTAAADNIVDDWLREPVENREQPEHCNCENCKRNGRAVTECNCNVHDRNMRFMERRIGIAKNKRTNVNEPDQAAAGLDDTTDGIDKFTPRASWVRRHSCDQCEKRFQKRATLMKHIQNNHTPSTSICEWCKKSFTFAKILRQHQKHMACLKRRISVPGFALALLMDEAGLSRSSLLALTKEGSPSPPPQDSESPEDDD